MQQSLNKCSQQVFLTKDTLTYMPEGGSRPLSPGSHTFFNVTGLFWRVVNPAVHWSATTLQRAHEQFLCSHCVVTSVVEACPGNLTPHEWPRVSQLNVALQEDDQCCKHVFLHVHVLHSHCSPPVPVGRQTCPSVAHCCATKLLTKSRDDVQQCFALKRFCYTEAHWLQTRGTLKLFSWKITM